MTGDGHDSPAGRVTLRDPPAEKRSRHRPEIQALRAIAVLTVVLYHVWPEAMPGGFVGVDVFFAISGFLITAHLAARGRGHRRTVAVGLLGAARAAPAARRAADAVRLRGRHAAASSRRLLAAVPHRDRRQHGLRPELAAGGRRRRLPRRRQPRLAGPALLVAVGRGAVLHPLAAADRGRAPGWRARAIAIVAVLGLVTGAEPRLLDHRDGVQPRRGVLRDADARLGVRRRRPARAARPAPRAARRRPRGAVLGGPGGDPLRVDLLRHATRRSPARPRSCRCSARSR